MREDRYTNCCHGVQFRWLVDHSVTRGSSDEKRAGGEENDWERRENQTVWDAEPSSWSFCLSRVLLLYFISIMHVIEEKNLLLRSTLTGTWLPQGLSTDSPKFDWSLSSFSNGLNVPLVVILHPKSPHRCSIWNERSCCGRGIEADFIGKRGLLQKSPSDRIKCDSVNQFSQSPVSSVHW